jgi:hypothetical protein
MANINCINSLPTQEGAIMKYFSIALFAFACAAGLPSNVIAAETTLCTDVKGVEIIEGPVRSNPMDEFSIPPGIDDGYVNGYPSLTWPDMANSLSPVTLRCFKQATDSRPALVKTLEDAPSSCTFTAGTLKCKSL